MDNIFVLLDEINKGNRQSFEELKSIYTPLLNKLISSFTFTGAGGKNDLSDIAENALLNAAVTYDSSKGIAFGYYAKVCITNALTTAYRASASERKRKNKIPKIKKADRIISIPAFSGLTEDEIKAKINTVLSPYERVIFEEYLEGNKPARIGELIGKDAKSVSNAIFRIRSKIRNIQ